MNGQKGKEWGKWEVKLRSLFPKAGRAKRREPDDLTPSQSSRCKLVGCDVM